MNVQLFISFQKYGLCLLDFWIHTKKPSIKFGVAQVHQGDLSLSAGPVKSLWTQHFFDRNTVSQSPKLRVLSSES